MSHEVSLQTNTNSLSIDTSSGDASIGNINILASVLPGAYEHREFITSWYCLSLVTGVFLELNQYRSSIRTVSDQYAHICIRPVRIACLRATLVEMIRSGLQHRPVAKSSVAFLGTDLDQLDSSSDSKHTIQCIVLLHSETLHDKSELEPI